MKTTLTALAVSACMLGIGSAAPTAAPKDSKAPQQESGRVHAKASHKKAQVRKKTEATGKDSEGKAADQLAAQLTKINERKAHAEADRRKAAEALKTAENQIVALDYEKKRLEARKNAMETAAREKAELDRKREAQQAEAKQRQDLVRMQSEIRELKQTVERLTQQVTDLRSKPTPPAKEKK